MIQMITIFSRSRMFLLRRMSTSPPGSSSDQVSMGARYKPSEFQKFILVWTKKYKSKEEVPNFITAELIERSRSEARIKLSNILIVLTALASFGAILAGKAAAKRGESVQQNNLDWHKSYNEQQAKKEASK